MLCGLLLTFVRDYFARAALWIGITEAVKNSTCRLFVTDIMLAPKDQDLCDYVAGFQTAAPITALYLFIVLSAIGQSWRSATLGQDYGRFSFRPWSYRVTPTQRGALTVMARASNRAGATQTFELILNPAGYHHNVVQRIALNVA